MIHIVTVLEHTLTNLVQRQGARHCRQWSYRQLLLKKSLPSGTWIFTDHDLLSVSDLAEAARVATRLESRGSRVLNHPARVRSRLELLRRLHEVGINTFTAMRCDSCPRPTRFPVFIRNAYDHDSRNLELLNTQDELNAMLQQMEQRGLPLIGKLVIEFAGEELFPNVWHRLSSYRVGDQTIAHHMAIGPNWIVKDGVTGAALDRHPHKESFLALEKEFVTKNQYADVLTRAFALARIDYGRADFAIVNDRVQIYEINTNPSHGNEVQVMRESHPRRRPVQKQSEDEVHTAIGRLNQEGGRRIRIRDSLAKRVKRRVRSFIPSGRRP